MSTDARRPPARRGAPAERDLPVSSGPLSPAGLEERLPLLLEAVVGLAADLDLDSVLRRVVEAASRLVGARYVALGVLASGPGRRLSAFVTHGLTEAERTRIGDPPHGRGLLGALIDHPEPLRLRDLTAHPSSYGFPPEHPLMTSFLGVPVLSRGRVFGNLYLTQKQGGGDFDEEDESIVVALAAAAGVVVENARLYEEAARRERWLAATAEISGLLLGAGSRDDALRVVADRAREVAGADLASVVLVGGPAGDLDLHIVSGVPRSGLGDVHLSRDGSLVGQVVTAGELLVVPDLSTEPRVAMPQGTGAWPTLGPAILLPLRTSTGVQGVLTLAWTPEHTPEFDALDVRLPQAFAEQAALTLQLDQARADRELLAVFEDRDRIGRDLHDLVIQRLFAVGLVLESTGRMARDRPEMVDRLASAVDDLDATIKDIRRTIFALSVAEDSADIRGSVLDLVERAARTLKFRPEVRFVGAVNAAAGPSVGAHLTAVLRESLSNVVRHAGATEVRVTLEADDGLCLTIADDGRGMPADHQASGLRNMRERAEQLGGSCTVTSRPGQGTTVMWRVPAART